jgi:hypothetical protein
MTTGRSRPTKGIHVFVDIIIAIRFYSLTERGFGAGVKIALGVLEWDAGVVRSA